MTGEFRQNEMSWGDSWELSDNDVMILVLKILWRNQNAIE